MEGSQVKKFQKKFVSFFLYIDFVFKVDPDEMQHNAAFNPGLHCM